MALLTFQSITQSGGGITLAAPTASDTVSPNDRGFLYYENTNAATRTVTIPAPAGLDFGPSTLPDLTYTLGATTGRLWIPLPQQLADPATGLITVTISATANVTMAAILR